MEVEPNALSIEYSALHPVSFSLPHPAPQHPYTHRHANAAQPDLFTTSTLVLARPDRNVQAPLLDEVHIQNVSRVQVSSQHCTAGTKTAAGPVQGDTGTLSLSIPGSGSLTSASFSNIWQQRVSRACARAVCAGPNVQCVAGGGDDCLRHAARISPHPGLCGPRGLNLGVHRRTVCSHSAGQQGVLLQPRAILQHCVVCTLLVPNCEVWGHRRAHEGLHVYAMGLSMKAR